MKTDAAALGPELSALAHRAGVIANWTSAKGEPAGAAAEDVAATLALLGHDPSGAGGIAAALDGLAEATLAEVLPPVQVAWDGRFVVPAARATGNAPPEMWLETEDGRHLSVEPGALVDCGLGLHELMASFSDRIVRTTVVAAPWVPWSPQPGEERRWGLFAPLYGLARQRGQAFGDLSDLSALFDWLHQRGGVVVVTLPLLAAFLDSPTETSPYSPVSRRAWNELYVDVDALAGYDDAGSQPFPPVASTDPFVDYDAAWAHRRPALQRAAEEFFAGNGTADPAYQRFLAERPAIARYARFRGAGARLGRDWRKWPTAARAGRLSNDHVDADQEGFHLFVQWVMHRQLGDMAARVEARGQMLALDLALGAHPSGFDVWDRQDLFVEGASVGAPPDLFFTRGQDWGFPPIHPERSRLDGHLYFRECLRHHFDHARLLRIDHVIGLHRLFWVRSDVGSGRGCYVRNHQEELLAVLCLEAWRRGAIVVGENLGTVPPEVDHALAEHRLLGTYVLQGEAWAQLRGHGTPPAPVSSVATFGTHDMPTFTGFWLGGDIDDRHDLGLVNDEEAAAEHVARGDLRRALEQRWGLPGGSEPAEVYAAVVAELGSSVAQLVVLSAEDLWGEPDPQNLPGTTHERPNWRRRLALPLSEWSSSEGLEGLLSQLAATRRREATTG